MSTIKVVESHGKSVDQVKAGLSQFEAMFKKYGVKLAWNGAKASLNGPVSGSIAIGSADIAVEIKLGMLAKMAGIDSAKLENSIRKRLKVALSE